MSEERVPLKLTDCYDCVGPGWAAILTMMHAELQAVCPGYLVLQVKEKFGGLRAYISVPRGPGMNPEEETISSLAFSIEHKYEGLSTRVCEVCGKAGTNEQNAHLWYKTLCEEHK